MKKHKNKNKTQKSATHTRMGSYQKKRYFKQSNTLKQQNK